MRPIKILVLTIITILGASTSALAQDATPPSGDEMGAGLSFEYIGGGTMETLPEAPVLFEMLRIEFEPNASFPIDAADPSITLALVEQGELTFLVDGPVTVFHPMEMTEELVPAGQEFTLVAGDSALFPPNIAGEIGNQGTTSSSVLLSNIAPIDAGAEATPAA